MSLSNYIACFLISNIDELILNCEAIFREIEDKENEILTFLNSLINPNAQNSSEQNIPNESDDDEEIKTNQNIRKSITISREFSKNLDDNEKNAINNEKLGKIIENNDKNNEESLILDKNLDNLNKNEEEIDIFNKSELIAERKSDESLILDDNFEKNEKTDQNLNNNEIKAKIDKSNENFHKNEVFIENYKNELISKIIENKQKKLDENSENLKNQRKPSILKSVLHDIPCDISPKSLSKPVFKGLIYKKSLKSDKILKKVEISNIHSEQVLGKDEKKLKNKENKRKCSFTEVVSKFQKLETKRASLDIIYKTTDFREKINKEAQFSSFYSQNTPILKTLDSLNPHEVHDFLYSNEKIQMETSKFMLKSTNPPKSFEKLEENKENLKEKTNFECDFKVLNKLKRVFSLLQYTFSQFGRVIHYINIANSPNPRAKQLNSSYQKNNNQNNNSKMAVSSEEHCYEDFQDDNLEEEEKLMNEIIKSENKKKKMLKLNIPLPILSYESRIKSQTDENNLITTSKKKKSLEVYFKWKLHKWDSIERPKKRQSIFGIPCRICLNKIWSNKLAVHSKLCLQRSQISNELDNHKKSLNKFIDFALENKRNIEIQRTLEKYI